MREFEVEGEDATAMWRQVRGHFLATVVAVAGALVLSLLIFDRSTSQVTWIVAGVGTCGIAVMIARFDLVGFSYTTGSDSSPTFVGRRPPVPRSFAVPVMLVVSVLLLLAGTSWNVGYWLAARFDDVVVVKQAGENAWGAILLPISLPLLGVVLVLFAGIACALLGSGLYQLAKFILHRRDRTDGTGLSLIGMGLLIAGFLAFFGYSIWSGWEAIVAEFVQPFQAIVDWFS